MKLTEDLKRWLQENKAVPKDATDEEYTKAASEAMTVDGTLTIDQFTELSKDPDAEKATELGTKMDAMVSAMQANQKAIAALMEQSMKAAEKVETHEPAKMKKIESGVTEAAILEQAGQEGDGLTINHITPDKRYSTIKGARYFPERSSLGLRHPSANERMFEGGRAGKRYIDELSELDRAVNGAYAKWAFLKEAVDKGILPKSVITDHDRELVHYALHNMNWGGTLCKFGQDEDRGIGVNNRRLTDVEIKQILDDGGASGGTHMVPIVFDDAVISTPLLHSEFYPRVNVVTITSGRDIDGASYGNLTLTWAATEATAITLETTASFIDAFDTEIMTVTGAIRMGLDFLEDTPINFGDRMVEEYGKRLLHELDDVIVAGNGTTQPTGINGLGTGPVAFGAAWTIGNLANLMLSIPKEYKAGYDNNRICFGADPGTYSDCRQIATGVTGDTRLVLGDAINNYTALGHPFLINDSYGDQEMTATNLARYRMYRRLGLTTRMSDDGRTLMQANQMILVARARFGGQLEDVSASAYTTTGAV